MKKEVETIDATPSKRIYQSIIKDYNLEISLCELIDNALDLWKPNSGKRGLRVEVTLNFDQQVISIQDNAGGVKDLKDMIAPGHTGNTGNENTIGFFGVGSKRAAVAIAQEISIQSRLLRSKETFQIEYDDKWLQDESWDIPYY